MVETDACQKEGKQFSLFHITDACAFVNRPIGWMVRCTLHGRRFEGVEPALEAVKAACLQAPGDAQTASPIDFLHVWRPAAHARQPPGVAVEHR